MESVKFDLVQEYAGFEEVGKRLLLENGVQADAEMWPPEQDTRRGLGVFFFQNGIRENSQVVLRELAAEFPEEMVVYGLPESPATQHVTFLELAGTMLREEFDMSTRPLISQFHQVVAETVRTLPPVRAVFRGLAVNPSTVIMKGYPESNAYNEVREVLRERIRAAGLPELKRRKVQIFHTTVARFKKPVRDVQRLIEVVGKYRDYDFGEDTFDRLEMACASWLMAPSQVERLEEYRL